ncbi:MAG: triose-phosphate isomerase [Chloroflexi bacterium HGW-Chloroflexi-10]|nr:MAG: triose-phosphate isomerase [Chloroflexi bacterium HGW-Chloroflexi-10]
MRKPLVAGNWKMHKTSAEALTLVAELRTELENINDVETVFCPPFTCVFAVSEALKDSSIGVGVQNAHWEVQGAFTGEISPVMVKEFAKYVIIGHSERRTFFGETDESVNKRVKAVLDNDLIPIVCVGETLEENKAGLTETVVSRQMRLGLADIAAEKAGKIVIAYEPVWAIGTGLACDSNKANEIILNTIRQPLKELFGTEIADMIRVLYGGSVKGSNAKEYFTQSEIDGALVGGASLKKEFIDIVTAAAG